MIKYDGTQAVSRYVAIVKLKTFLTQPQAKSMLTPKSGKNHIFS